MKNIYLLLLLLNLKALAQSTSIDCNKILNEDLLLFIANINAPIKDSSFLKVLDNFKECGKLDSIDIELVNGPSFHSIFSIIFEKKESFTYASILNAIKEFQKSEEYPIFRETTIKAQTLERKILNLSEFDKEFFIQKNMSLPEIETIRLFLIEIEADGKINYKEALKKYIESRTINNAPDFEKIKSIFDNYKTQEESTDSEQNKNEMKRSIENLALVSNPPELEILIDVWMYYDPTDFPCRSLIFGVLKQHPSASLKAVQNRMANKKKWEDTNTAPFSDLNYLLGQLKDI